MIVLEQKLFDVAGVPLAQQLSCIMKKRTIPIVIEETVSSGSNVMSGVRSEWKHRHPSRWCTSIANAINTIATHGENNWYALLSSSSGSMNKYANALLRLKKVHSKPFNLSDKAISKSRPLLELPLQEPSIKFLTFSNIHHLKTQKKTFFEKKTSTNSRWIRVRTKWKCFDADNITQVIENCAQKGNLVSGQKTADRNNWLKTGTARGRIMFNSCNNRDLTVLVKIGNKRRIRAGWLL